MATLKEVNTWAKKSCPRWNSGFPKYFRKFLRRYYRKKYRDAALERYYSNGHQDLVRRYKSGEKMLNTYPYPYSDERFADWEEDDSKRGYSLISDQSGCVVKYATSYVAYKIFEETGVWPQKKTSRRLDAKKWDQFLAEAGYDKGVLAPKSGHHYVGIKPDEGEFGLVVWFEEVDDNDYVDISTYYDKAYFFGSAKIKDFKWVEID